MELDVAGRTPYLCECEDQGCTQLIRLTQDEYAGLRSNGAQFVIAPGHPTRGRPVERNEHYVVVDKEDA
jgi:hypothetical protein